MKSHYMESGPLRQIYEEGLRLIERPEKSIPALRAWFAAGKDLLARTLPEHSALLEEFQSAREAFSKAAEEQDLESLQELIEKGNQVIYFAGTPDFRPRRLSSSFDDLYIRDHERLVHSILTDIYLKSWWVKLPSALLIAALALAITGVIKIQDLKIDIYEQTDKALAKTKQRIQAEEASAEDDIKRAGSSSVKRIESARETAENDVRASISDYGKQEKRRIYQEATKQIDELKKERAPNIEIRLDRLQGAANAYEKKAVQIEQGQRRQELELGVLENSFRVKIGPRDYLSLASLGAFLERSQRFVLIELVAMSVTILLFLGLLFFLLFGRLRSRWSHARSGKK